MPLLRWCRPLLTAALVLVGYTSTPAAADKGAATAPAPSKATTLAPAPVPALEASLAYLKPAGSERCGWIRQPLPSGAPITLFSFDTACNRSEFSWSPNGRQGLVLGSPRGEGAVQRIWSVDFAAKAGTPVDLKGLPAGTGERGPGKPRITRVGFDAQGRPVALLYVSAEPEQGPGGDSFIPFEGERYPVTKVAGDKQGLALAYRLESSDWKRFEVKAGGSYTVLDANGAMYDPGPSRTERLPGQEASKSAARMLNSAQPPRDRFGKWMALPTPGGTLLYRGKQLDADDEAVSSAPVRWEQNGKLVELEGLKAKPGDMLVFQLRNELLVINVLGETSAAHVYDTRTKKNLATVKDITAPVALWPEPSRP